MILSLAISAATSNCVAGRPAYSATQAQSASLSVAVNGLPRYSRKEMRVHRFLWAKWQQRQVATAEITFFGIDAGNIYTVYIKKDSTGRWTITEYMRHYQVVGTSDEAAKLVATGIALRRFRLRNGVFAVWLVNDQGKTVPMFE